VWVRPDVAANGATQRIFAQGSPGGGNAPLAFNITAAGAYQIGWWNGVDYYSITSSNGLAQNNTWAWLAGAKSVNSIALWVGGTRVAYSATGIQTTVPTVTEVFSIGRQGAYNGQYYKGYVQDLRFTKGICRYAPTDLTIPVPSSPWPDQ
jgi:hypothetical protein